MRLPHKPQITFPCNKAEPSRGGPAFRSKPRAVSAGNSDIRVEAETRHAGATGADSTVDRFRIYSVPRQHNAAASVDPGGEAAADGTRVDLRQPGLIARQRIRVFRVRLSRVQAATLQQGANPLRQRLRQFSDFGILGRAQSKELRLSMQSRRVYAIDAKYVEMDMKIRGRPKPLHESDRAALRLVDTVVVRQPAVKAK